jgi:tRNA pseudouridine38-40 synthase
MPRYKITIEYDGTGLAGWQFQPEMYSVQEALENALLQLTAEKAEVFGSGRTDAGVHALGQVAHFDLEKEWDAFRLHQGMNFYLRVDEKLPTPMQIAVVKVEVAASDFESRFHAKKRFYEYRIINRRSHLALDQNRAWGVPEELDAAKMHEAAQLLIGNHDYSTFRSSACQSKSPVKSIDAINVTRMGDEILLTINARSFLHHQVRNITGSLKMVGQGKWSIADFAAAFAAKDRRAGGVTAPAQGLYFVRVEY